MLKLTRHFATRLRGAFPFLGAGAPAPTSSAFAFATESGAWRSLSLHLAAPRLDEAAARERELRFEYARQLVTLIGQNGPAVAGYLGGLDAEVLEHPAAALVLYLADRVGNDATRRALGGLTAGC